MGSSKSWRRFEYIYQYVALGQHSEHTMARGPVKHLKRMFAPSHWMLDKLRGRWAPKPHAGPHKLRECMPLIVMLRLIKVDGQVRSDMFFPAGFMDVVQIEKTKE